MQDQFIKHMQIWGTIATAQLTSWGIDEINAIAGIFALICGGIASLSIAWWHIFKKPK